jgi:tripartite-type tricarboxylate transporter receptor subunit TctC
LWPRKLPRSAPGDGYSLLMTGNNTAIAAALFKSLPYNVLTDFASISTAAFFDLLVVTRAGSPLHSVKDVIAAARANPGKLNIGTINPGSTQNLAAELFISTAEIKAAIVPFRTSPDMAGALLRSDIDVAVEFYARYTACSPTISSSRSLRPGQAEPPICRRCRP